MAWNDGDTTIGHIPGHDEHVTRVPSDRVRSFDLDIDGDDEDYRDDIDYDPWWEDIDDRSDDE